MTDSPDYEPIERHGVIGDLHTVALVAMNGSIDFMCFPRFDSPSVFASLLDRERGGHFRIAPILEEARHKQLYLPDSNVLLTRFLSREGVAEISDFMPVEEVGWAHNVVRRVKTVRGEVRYRLVCAPRFDYGKTGHTVERRGAREVVFVPESGPQKALRLRGGIDLDIENGAAVAEFTLPAGKHAAFVLEEAEEGTQSPSEAGDYEVESFKSTMNFWRRWIERSTYRGRWREAVNRSALALKLLVSQEFGSMVAAPTFGLPEEIGGSRNWDYRYTWIRDASFTLYALIRLGYTEEAGAFMGWIEDRCLEPKPDGSLQIMYGIDGRHRLDEEVLDHLEGYRGSRPVRIGNAASRQVQLDIYGELMDAAYLYDKYGEMLSLELWDNLVRLVDWVGENWRNTGEGIWEIRGQSREFLFSRLMCWVAVDRAVRLAAKRSFPAPVDRWRKIRDEIHAEILKGFWDGERGTFVRYRGAKTVDASTLLMPLVRFIAPRDPRWLSTLAAIEEKLVDDSLVYRCELEDTEGDGLAGKEGTFSMCSFWYVECLSRAGDLDKARFLFEKMLGYSNHLGLYSEELGPRGEHLGNYPQAFTHLALISAAYDLDRRLERRG